MLFQAIVLALSATFALAQSSATNTSTATCDTTQCPSVANGYPICANGACSFACNDSYKPEGSWVCLLLLSRLYLMHRQCVLVNNSTCDPTSCPSVANGTATCKDNTCSFDCDSGFEAEGSWCVALDKCDVSQCTAPKNGTATCKDNACSFDCDEGFEAEGDWCVLLSPQCEAMVSHLELCLPWISLAFPELPCTWQRHLILPARQVLCLGMQ
jgi:hypothetical protein